MAFSKREFEHKINKWIEDNNLKDISDDIYPILASNSISNIPFKPTYLILKEGIPFFLVFFQKGRYPVNKRLQERVTGIDYYKYKLLLYIEKMTGIQVAIVMHNEEEDKFIFTQLDLINPPIMYFRGTGCYANELRKDSIRYNCGKCFEECPRICDECIHKRKDGRKKKRREMAMWPVSYFNEEVEVQPKMF